MCKYVTAENESYYLQHSVGIEPRTDIGGKIKQFRFFSLYGINIHHSFLP